MIARTRPPSYINDHWPATGEGGGKSELTNIPALLEGKIVTDKKENRHGVGVTKFRDPGYESTTGNGAHSLEVREHGEEHH